MKKMIMCLMMSALVANVAMAGTDGDAVEQKILTDIQKRQEATDFYCGVRNKDAAKAVGVLGLGWTALGIGGFVTHSKLKTHALKKAKLARVAGFVGMTPLVSFLAGYSIFRTGFNLRNETIENAGSVAMLPALGMVILPANWYADKKNADRYADYQAKMKSCD